MRTAGLWVPSMVFAVALSGCGGTATVLSDADRAAIEKSMVTDAMTALAAKDFDGYANLFTEDVALLPPNAPPFNGRPAMITWLKAFPPYSDFKLGSTTIQGSGDAAYVQGTYSMTLNLPGAPAPVADNGKWLVGARKQGDGSWRGTVVIFNSDLPVTAPGAPAK
jgi:ketosteroid isomerase-like protein